MKDPHTVLRQKDLDLERVRKEIQALLTVIPLLADDPPTSDVVHEVLLASPGRRTTYPEKLSRQDSTDRTAPNVNGRSSRKGIL